MMDDDPFWHFGRWSFGLFDDGWVFARGNIVRGMGKWPTWKTFNRRKQPPATHHAGQEDRG